MTATLVGLFIAAYFVGSIPFGVLIARAMGVDILKFGSGNPGATNVKRALGWKAAGPVFLLDVLKGLGPSLTARFLVPESVGVVDAQLVWMLVGLAAVAGHCWSPFLRFKGGKGIATSLGAGVGAAPIPALLGFAVFFVVVGITKYVSLASMAGVASVVAWGVVIPGQSLQLLPIFVLLAVFIIVTHRANIKRLREGTERKFSFGGGKPEVQPDPSKSKDKEV